MSLIENKELKTRIIESSESAAKYMRKESKESIGYGTMPWAGLIGRIARLGNNITYRISRRAPIGRVVSASSVASMIEFNIEMYKKTKDKEYLNQAIDGSNWLIQNQNKAGFWVFTTFERKRRRVQTVDSTMGALALISLYKVTGNSKLLLISKRWLEYIINNGLIKKKDHTYCMYYLDGDMEDLEVTNVACCIVHLMSEFYKVSNEGKYKKIADNLIPFIKSMQLSSGEFRYSSKRDHYQGPQYNAFQLIFLLSYYEITKDKDLKNILEATKNYLESSVNKDGSVQFGPVKYAFNTSNRKLYYHSAAVAAALSEYKYQIGNVNERKILDSISFALLGQRIDGSFSFGQNALFGLIDDIVPYPRYIGYTSRLLLKCIN